MVRERRGGRNRPLMAGMRVVGGVGGGSGDAENVREHGNENLSEDSRVASAARGEEGLAAGQCAVLEEAFQETDAGLLLLGREVVVVLSFVRLVGFNDGSAKFISVGSLQPSVENVDAVRRNRRRQHDLETLDGRRRRRRRRTCRNGGHDSAARLKRQLPRWWITRDLAFTQPLDCAIDDNRTAMIRR